MLKFIHAENLKKKFGVFGHFYSVTLESGERIECRSVLEIVSHVITPVHLNELSIQEADALFIMMNPGSSKPLVEVNSVYPQDNTNKIQTDLVPTKPDTTQYQVMRVMKYCNWEHVRVLNLSDLRDPKSGKFMTSYQRIEAETGFAEHSVFSKKRRHELESKLKLKSDAPIILAWGVSPDLEPLIERCLESLGEHPKVTGLLKEDTESKYYHPLPTLQKGKIEWVNNMVKLLESQSAGKA